MGFSPLYGDWMSASQPRDAGGRAGALAPRFQSPLWGLDECFETEQARLTARKSRFQSPLWGLDECFVRRRPRR